MDTIEQVNAIAPWFFPVCAFVFGACIGSFLNVCIYRLPKGESVVTPGSHCACGQPIAWRDNIPILSWLLLRGRARCCGRPFSFRYPFIELLTALLFVACWMLFPPAKAVAGMVLVSIVICATFTDVDGMIIPDAFTIGGGVAGVLISLALPALHGQAHDLYVIASLRAGLDAVLGLLVGSGVVLWIALVAEAVLKKEAMGFGDVKYLGALGAFVGWQGAVFAVFGGAIIGCVWVLFALLWQKISGKTLGGARLETPDGQPTEQLGLGVHVSFGPMLGAGALLYFFVLQRWVDAYFESVRFLF
ncbi:MAG TPA: prepilin peptidase [Acidobacteriota bacterium]|nr:prepilin peptidase [Acidobacteriota bacterium]